MLKKCAVISAFLIFFAFSLSAEDWVLAAQEFSFSNSLVNQVQKGAARLLPQLILEQLSSSYQRFPSELEVLERKNNELYTERVSLFLQLSKENQVRDSIVLKESNPQKRQQLINDEQKKIDEINLKIRENLEKQKSIIDIKKDFLLLDEQQFDSLKKYVEETAGKKEKVVLYKNNFENILSGSESEIAEKIQNEKIHGLIDGNIISYGDYFLVTVNLNIYPGKISGGSVTEVGSFDELEDVAHRISQVLLPHIANVLPVEIFFNFTGVTEDEKKNISMKVDGVHYNSVPEKITVNAGLHSFDFDLNGFVSKSVSWDFSDEPSFIINVPMKKNNDGNFSLCFNNPYDGTLYLNGQMTGVVENGVLKDLISVNGRPCFGELISNERRYEVVDEVKFDEDGNAYTEKVYKDNGPIITYFYISPFVQIPETVVVVNTDVIDLSKEINERRIWMYRGYSALVCSVPLYLICLGNTNSAIAGYNNNPSENMRQVYEGWSVATYVTGGVSIVAGCFFVYELVRYLYTAGKVVPSEALNGGDENLFVYENNASQNNDVDENIEE